MFLSIITLNTEYDIIYMLDLITKSNKNKKGVK